MGRGVLTGLVWGMFVSALVLALVSLSTPLPDRADAPAPMAPEAPAETPPAAPEPAPAPEPQPEPIPEPAPPPAPEPPAAATPEPPPAPEPEPEPTPSPEPADEAAAEEAPAIAPAPAALPATSAAPEAPARLPQVDAAPASVPPVASAAEAETPPPAPETAPAPTPVVAAAPQPPRPEPAPAPSPSFSSTADASAGGAAPRRLTVPQPADAPAAIDTAPPAPAPVAAAPAPDPAPDPAPAPRLPQVGAATEAPTGEATATSRLPQVTAPAMPEAVAAAPAPRLPQVASPGSTRLPQTGTPEPPPPVAEAAAPPAPAAPRALRDNAVPFDAPADQALLAVVLIDTPEGGLDAATLAGLGFPVSFALDPLRPDAAARAAELRAAGFEVVILGAGAIPAGATPSDVEVALAAAQTALPQAVALMDDPEGRIQGDRPVLDATVAALAETGHGLLAFPRGLNPGEETARRNGLPAATVFRLLDDEDQSAPVITRFLGRAAFAAGQEGAAVVVGRTRPDTVTALFSWALGGRTEGVALAPVSAVLLRLAE
ncbi:divergent polysaccharide deacetylase family protein [Roseicyclus persicicus]|uniref:Divergent polysaccharide deacetylase family protein n=1 Tax=Roseicyclus persicicus TaxID=2650661 RepID=A0A7X6JXR0_9RHOB|nr:divergent polysaccharide deacetylase family protein [Roseibacterium persicicum]NKX45807.1 divergent polysaccharide deacetylase family protein [Roseibacterium persicicum]